MSDEPKFCKDCKHYVPIPPFGLWAAQQAQNSLIGWSKPSPTEAVAIDAFRDYCRHPSKRDLVSGESAEDPKVMRAGSCGPEAWFWEERPAPEVIVTVTYPAQPYVRPEAPYFTQEPCGERARWWEFWK